MSAATYIGRVGGLAVAFGIGTAVLTGYGIASAEPTSGPSDSPSSSERSGDPVRSPGAPKATKRTHSSSGADSSGSGSGSDGSSGGNGAGDAGGDGSATDDATKGVDPSAEPATGTGTGSSDVVTADDPVDPSASGVTGGSAGSGTGSGETTQFTQAAAPEQNAGDQPEASAWLASPQAVAGRTPASPSTTTQTAIATTAVTPVVATGTATATATPTATATVSNPLLALINSIFNPFAGDGPASPAGSSPLSWAMAAAARRETLVSSGPISVDPTFNFTNGVIYGSVGATDSNGNPLIYTLLGNPDKGGKITFNPDGTFSFLPDLSVVNSRGTESFKVMVSEKNFLVSLLEQVPIIGGFVQPIVLGLQQIPILGALLQPIIGYRVITPIDVDIADVVPLGARVAFTTMVTSFDLTQISVNFFPATNLGPLEQAPTVLNGPGLGSAGNIDPTSLTIITDLVPGLVPLRDGGYNVVTWDPRGEFASGGVLQLDNPFFEGRDVQAIIDWLALRPEAELDGIGDPKMGMVGGSYGGGIQLVTAGIDKRVDAIVPVIAWNSLNEALYPTHAFKSAWASLLALDLLEAGARINSQIYPAVLLGNLLGVITAAQEAVLASSGPTVLVSSITAPTLLIQGTADGLFTLAQAVQNALQLDAKGTPVSMIWACGGHGVCLDPLSPLQTPLLINSTVAWLDKYVKDELVPSTPRFEWFDQNGVYHSSDKLPSDPTFYGDPLVTEGTGGFLPIIPLIGGSGPQTQSPTPLIVSPALASEASIALNLDIPDTADTVEIVGAPVVTLHYSGLGTSTHIYGQLVDEVSGLVLGNLVTPIPVTLDGRPQEVTIPLEQIAYTMAPGAKLKLQLVGFATPYLNITQFGYINVDSVSIELPTVARPPAQQAALAGVTVGVEAA